MSYLREIVKLVSGPPKPTESWSTRKCEGYLIKEGSNFKTWKERYFILNHNGYLFYFKTDTATKEPLGYFQVDNLEWVIIKNKKKGPAESSPIVPNCIKITRSPPLFLYTEEEEEMNKWKKALTQIGCRMALTEKEKKLPIVFVYDMREHKDQWKEIKRIFHDAVGKKIAIEIDWNAFADSETIDKSNGRVVRCLYDYLEHLAKAVDKSCKGGEIEREAFINGVYQSTVKVELDPSLETYHTLELNDGALVLKSHDKKFWGNAHKVGSNLEELYQYSGEHEVPLAIRKNIRDSNKYLAECLDIMKSLSGGQTFSFEVDWKAIIYSEKVTRKQWDDMAEVVFKDYLLKLVKTIADLSQDELVWKALFEALTQKKICFGVKNLESAYNATSVVGGVLYLHVSPNGYRTNMHTVGKDLLKSIQNSGDDELPLDARKNIKDEDEKRVALIENLKEITGEQYDIIVDWTTIAASIKESDLKKIAQLTYDQYLKTLVKRIDKLCQDDMVKQAFISSTPARVIRFTMAPLEGGYNAVRLSQDGALILECKIDNGWCTNVHAVGSHLEDLLVFSSSAGKLPLPVRKSIRDSEKYKEEVLQTFHNISGRDYEIEVNWEELIGSESIDKSQWNRLGEVVFKSYLLTLAKNISNMCKDELITQAFTEHTHANKITFGMATLSSGQYHSVEVKDGVLAVSYAKGGWYTNIGNLGKNDLLDQLSDRDQEAGKLPLILRLSIAENANRLESILSKWRDFAGEDGNITVDWDSVLSHVERNNLKNVGKSLQDEVPNALVNNFKRIVGECGKELRTTQLRILFKKLGTSPYHLVQYNEENNSYELILNSVHYLTNVGNVGKKEIESLLVEKKEDQPEEEETPAQEDSQEETEETPAAEEESAPEEAEEETTDVPDETEETPAEEETTDAPEETEETSVEEEESAPEVTPEETADAPEQSEETPVEENEEEEKVTPAEEEESAPEEAEEETTDAPEETEETPAEEETTDAPEETEETPAEEETTEAPEVTEEAPVEEEAQEEIKEETTDAQEETEETPAEEESTPEETEETPAQEESTESEESPAQNEEVAPVDEEPAQEVAPEESSAPEETEETPEETEETPVQQEESTPEETEETTNEETAQEDDSTPEENQETPAAQEESTPEETKETPAEEQPTEPKSEQDETPEKDQQNDASSSSSSDSDNDDDNTRAVETEADQSEQTSPNKTSAASNDSTAVNVEASPEAEGQE